MKKDNYRRRNALLVFILFGFSPSFSQQTIWTQKANFFEAREGAASFTINNKLYVGTGNEKNDLWEYDPSINVWTQKADLPARGRSYATGFSIGNKGYIATGTKVNRYGLATLDSLMNDVWEYDPAADNWTKKADFAGGRRARAVAFVLNNKAYVGSGEKFPAPIMSREYPIRVTQDFWAFDPVANTWTQIADIPMRRMNAIGFSSNGKGFVGTGFYNTYTKSDALDRTTVYPGDNLQDLWAYDTATNTWAKKSDFPGGKLMGMSVFSIGDTAYTMVGAEVVGSKFWTSDTDIIKKDVWAYNTITDTWVQKHDFPDTARRRYSIAAAIAGKGYFGMGRVNDLWEYNTGNTLPVTLVSFAGTIRSNKAVLDWKIENEQSLDKYEVERSVDGRVFTKSGEVKALNRKQYSYEDNSYSTKQIFYYRLKIVHKDGSFNYSGILKLINSDKSISIALYPSPLKGNSGYLNITSAKAQKLQVVITDITGHQVSTQAINIIAGSNNIPLTFGKLAAGTYLLQIINEKNESKVIRFMKD